MFKSRISSYVPSRLIAIPERSALRHVRCPVAVRRLETEYADICDPTTQKNGYEPEALLNFVALMGWSRQAPVSDSETVGSPTQAAKIGASLAKLNSTIPVSKTALAAQKMKGKVEPDEDVVDSDVMTLQELIDNVRLPFSRLIKSFRILRIADHNRWYSSLSVRSTSTAQFSPFRNSTSSIELISSRNSPRPPVRYHHLAQTSSARPYYHQSLQHLPTRRSQNRH